MTMNAARTKTMTNTEDALDEIKSRLAIGMAPMVKLVKVWKNK